MLLLLVAQFGLSVLQPGAARAGAALHHRRNDRQLPRRTTTDALFEPIAEDFVGSEGMDRKAFRRYVTLTGMRNQEIGVQLGPLDVKLFDQRATVSFTAALSGGASWLPDRAQVYQVDTGWRLEDGEWKLISAKWEPRL